MTKYIYESPDKGETIYRRPVGETDHTKRELISKQEADEIESQMDFLSLLG